MCGIVGIFGDNSPDQRAIKSLEQIIHRGTSHFELAAFPCAAIAANRLPIVDRANGHQPKFNENKTIFAVQNGEIFNYKELKAELTQLGHCFYTDSDTEVLVHLYEEYGTEMIHKIDSEMFAFIIYDLAKQQFFVARDRLGIKPLFYAYDTTGQLYFASELKQLAIFADIEKIYNFPPASYFLNGNFTQYFSLNISNDLQQESDILNLLEQQLYEAVKKRVATDLPIGVFFSGGVDSSLILEIANRLHPDVTALILGFEGSPDYEYAIRFCKEKQYKYHLITPNVDYEKELDQVIYHLETYEPLIIRHGFALELCAKAARKLNLDIVLVGEGADELFAGYNEFISLPAHLVNKGCLMLIKSLNAGHFLRIDRMSMKHTIEVRCPFFDQKIVETALQIDGNLKIKKEDHTITTKYIIRKLAERFLPSYLAWRYKMPFSNGAGMQVGNNYKAEDGEVAKIIKDKPEVKLSTKLVKKYRVKTKEEMYYLKKYIEFGFSKLVDSEKRLIVKDTLTEINHSQYTSLILAEDCKLALYFPIYFAKEIGLFKQHKLTVDFLSTGSDQKVLESLMNNSAQIGLADPIISQLDNPEKIKGKIIAELIHKIPLVAIALNPDIKIKSLSDFNPYKVAAFSSLNDHPLMQKLFVNTEKIETLNLEELRSALQKQQIDIAIVFYEQVDIFKKIGCNIIFDFQKILFPCFLKGLISTDILDQKYQKKLKSFVFALRESIRLIHKEKEKALLYFKTMFPALSDPDLIFNDYLHCWSTNPTKIERQGYYNSFKVWKSYFPNLLDDYVPYQSPFKSELSTLLEKFNSHEHRREFVFFEDQLELLVKKALSQNTPLKMVSFWGSGPKVEVDDYDHQTVLFFNEFIKNLTQDTPLNIEVTWILADKHAQNNGFDQKNYQIYLQNIKSLLESNKYKTIPLSILWQKWQLNHELIGENLLQHQKNENWWSTVAIASKLEIQAMHHFQKENYILGAQKYFLMRKMEKNYLEKHFKDYVFCTYSDIINYEIFPMLPTVYLYTRHRGTTEVPWFHVHG